MESRGAKEAVMERLGISMNKEQSAELYQELCNFLVAKDALAYIDLLRTKYELLQGAMRLPKCNYMIMELLLDKMEREHPLILAAVAYAVKYKS